MQIESALISCDKVREIISKFGYLVAELYRPDRCTLEDRENNRPFSLPVELLGYSKQQVQIALAVFIAELVTKSAAGWSENDTKALSYAAYCSGCLVHFTRKPATLKENMLTEFGSTDVYAEWKRKCELCLDEASSKSTNRPEAVSEYWKAIDRMIPDLLNNTTLLTVRES